MLILYYEPYWLVVRVYRPLPGFIGRDGLDNKELPGTAKKVLPDYEQLTDGFKELPGTAKKVLPDYEQLTDGFKELPGTAKTTFPTMNN